jgi:tetratricopeptide (TPR) repeat protein
VTNAAPDNDGLARALSLHRAGRAAEAEAAYRALLAADPDRSDGWYLLAILLNENRRMEEAAAAIDAAASRAPGEPLVRFTQGSIALGCGRIDDAIAALEAALACNPQFAEAATNLGLALARAGRVADAEAAHRRSLAIRPGYSLGLYNLGQLLHCNGRAPEAIDCYRAALAAEPGSLPAQFNLAAALRQNGETQAAEVEYRRAIALAPANSEGWLGLGLAQKDRGELDAAIGSFEESLRRNPTAPEAHLNLSLALLSLGRFAEAWPHYEQRWNAVPLVNHRRHFDRPAWDGAPLGRRTLLIHAEQGLGDTIQFIHLLRELDADPAQLIVEMPALLLPLLQPFNRYATLVAAGTTLPSFDCHAPLLDLPRLIGLTVDRIRPMTGVLEADPARVSRWRERLAGQGKLVALVWRGGEMNPENGRRSIDPALLAPLFERHDLRFVSLQKNEPVPHPSVIDPSQIAGPAGFDPKGAAFLDSAAILSVADHIVTVDTALAHVAGALGRPGHVLLPFVCDWRWLTARSDTPWYPPLTLMRQAASDDWRSVVERLIPALTSGRTA